jgi:hypothetical protein
VTLFDFNVSVNKTFAKAVFSFAKNYFSSFIYFFSTYLDLRHMEQRGNGRSCTVRSFIICTHPQISLGRSNQGETGGRETTTTTSITIIIIINMREIRN